MKIFFSFLAFLVLSSGFSQEINPRVIGVCYSKGEKIKAMIEENNIFQLKKEFGQTKNLESLLASIKGRKSKNSSYGISSDIYYDPDSKKYIFTIYSSRWIKTESDWGLNDYRFVIELMIEYVESNNEATIHHRRILNQNSNLKRWWQSFIDSYNNSKFQRKKWADEYGLVPPPPPPPQTTEWFKI
ncbi:hypothetical protein [Hyunsoonleella rubra]|uniref:DUF4468 domain-containing protein n=1 Tax=Hyunsoonleella rubra TaxID=1737062 RepID=A0ABW5T784_9FLAO